MKAHRWLLVAGLTFAAGPVFAGPAGCDLANITSSRELNRTLSLRAVELVSRAGNADDSLTALVHPSASFSLGAGDVGRPLETGAAGARQLAQLMNADTYRFLGWDHMDGPADGCSKQKVEVEFIDSEDATMSRVEFDFEEGRVVNASGWERSFETGQLGDAPKH
jgi:hypothetical protein